jgi:hypothetical protein
VKVEGDNGCTGTDSLFVAYDRPDLGINRLVSPATTCAEDQISPVSLEIINNGFLGISPEQDLIMTYSVNGGSSKIETFNLAATLEPGNMTTVTFTKGFDFTTTGVYSVYNSIIYENDVDYSNNTLTTEITIWDPISVEIGNGEDTLRTSLPVTLDAGSGFASYLWQNNSTGSSLVADSYGLYWVEVSNNIGCLARDSVVIASLTGISNDLIRSGQIKLYPNPVEDILNIDLTLDTERDLILEFYSALGQLMFREERDGTAQAEFDVNVQPFVPGVYMLKITADDVPYTYMIVVQ